jgi:hypothetical protein
VSSILSHLNQKDLFEAVIETEVLLDQTVDPSINPKDIKELITWYRNLEILGKGEWDTGKETFL